VTGARSNLSNGDSSYRNSSQVKIIFDFSETVDAPLFGTSWLFTLCDPSYMVLNFGCTFLETFHMIEELVFNVKEIMGRKFLLG
jgi:hypothetical protein